MSPTLGHPAAFLRISGQVQLGDDLLQVADTSESAAPRPDGGEIPVMRSRVHALQERVTLLELAVVNLQIDLVQLESRRFSVRCRRAWAWLVQQWHRVSGRRWG